MSIKKVRNILYNIKSKEKIIEVLEWYKKQTCGICNEFAYEIITLEEIEEIIKEYKSIVGVIHVSIIQSNVTPNPIFWWLFDGLEYLQIYDWISFRYALAYNGWLDDDDIEDFIIEFGGNEMKPISDVNKATLTELKEIDKNGINCHFNKNGTNDWMFDHDLKKWFYMPTNQTITEYLLENVPMALSPTILKEYTKDLLFKMTFNKNVTNMSNIDILNCISTKREQGDQIEVKMFGEWVTITQKQFRYIVNEAVERFILGEK